MGKTLKELNVKPGDVVQMPPYPERIVAGWENGNCYHTEQKFGGAESMSSMSGWSIVSRATPEIDLTSITTPLGLLDDATRDALKAHGGPYEVYYGDQWFGYYEPGSKQLVTRVKPSPKVETVELYGSEELHWIFSGSPVDCDTHKLTLKIQSGEIIGVTAEKLI